MGCRCFYNIVVVAQPGKPNIRQKVTALPIDTKAF
jgi:hypothetical protein